MGGRLSQFLMSHPGYEVQLGSRFRTESPYWLPEAKVVQIQWDSTNAIEKICAGVHAVVHLAGMNAQDCAINPLGALDVNGVATARLLDASVRQGVKRFIYLSTAHVYGSHLSGVITEETCPVSLHPYATSHRAGEDVVRYAHQYGAIEGVVVRLSNAYGAPAHKDANCWMLLVNDLCQQALATQHMMLRTSGLQRRDFITLTDVCGAIKHLLELPVKKLGDGLFNIGGAWSPTILEMTQRVAERIHVAIGQYPGISHMTEQKTVSPEPLSYVVKKLISTGFKLSSHGNVDREIDALIQFCLREAM